MQGLYFDDHLVWRGVEEEICFKINLPSLLPVLLLIREEFGELPPEIKNPTFFYVSIILTQQTAESTAERTFGGFVQPILTFSWTWQLGLTYHGKGGLNQTAKKPPGFLQTDREPLKPKGIFQNL